MRTPQGCTRDRARTQSPVLECGGPRGRVLSVLSVLSVLDPARRGSPTPVLAHAHTPLAPISPSPRAELAPRGDREQRVAAAAIVVLGTTRTATGARPKGEPAKTMRVTTPPALLRLRGLSRLSAMVLPLALAGCFVDEAPESSDGMSSSMTSPSTTDPSASSTGGSGSTSRTTQGTDSVTTTAASDSNTTNDSTATGAMTVSTSATSVTTGNTTSTGATTTTAGMASDSDPTSDPTDPPTTTTTTGGDPCADLELSLAMTDACVVGTSIENANFGHEICAQEFGVAWRWLEFHDGEALGWNAYGLWETPVGAGERGWVWIDDNSGQCWSSSHGMTWHRAEGESCKASCAPATGLEGEQYDPLPGKCNPYHGDTPCDLCRRLICVKG